MPSGVDALAVRVRLTASTLLAGAMPTNPIVGRPRLSLLAGSSRLLGGLSTVASGVPNAALSNGLPTKLRPVMERKPLDAGAVCVILNAVPKTFAPTMSRRTSIAVDPPGTILVEVAAPPAATSRVVTDWASAVEETSAPSATAVSACQNCLP